jgi:hypothetical protein
LTVAPSQYLVWVGILNHGTGPETSMVSTCHGIWAVSGPSLKMPLRLAILDGKTLLGIG